MDRDYIFVYGTLRRDLADGMHRLLAGRCEFLSYGFMQGRLYEVNGYPGAVESENEEERVFGEIYRVTDSGLLSMLDEYEECSDSFTEPREYVRKKVPVAVAGGRVVSAWVYVYNHETGGLGRIESGDFTKLP